MSSHRQSSTVVPFTSGSASSDPVNKLLSARKTEAYRIGRLEERRAGQAPAQQEAHLEQIDERLAGVEKLAQQLAAAMQGQASSSAMGRQMAEHGSRRLARMVAQQEQSWQTLSEQLGQQCTQVLQSVEHTRDLAAAGIAQVDHLRSLAAAAVEQTLPMQKEVLRMQRALVQLMQQAQGSEQKQQAQLQVLDEREHSLQQLELRLHEAALMLAECHTRDHAVVQQQLQALAEALQRSSAAGKLWQARLTEQEHCQARLQRDRSQFDDRMEKVADCLQQLDVQGLQWQQDQSAMQQALHTLQQTQAGLAAQYEVGASQLAQTQQQAECLLQKQQQQIVVAEQGLLQVERVLVASETASTQALQAGAQAQEQTQQVRQLATTLQQQHQQMADTVENLHQELTEARSQISWWQQQAEAAQAQQRLLLQAGSSQQQQMGSRLQTLDSQLQKLAQQEVLLNNRIEQATQIQQSAQERQQQYAAQLAELEKWRQQERRNVRDADLLVRELRVQSQQQQMQKDQAERRLDDIENRQRNERDVLESRLQAQLEQRWLQHGNEQQQMRDKNLQQWQQQRERDGDRWQAQWRECQQRCQSLEYSLQEALRDRDNQNRVARQYRWMMAVATGALALLLIMSLLWLSPKANARHAGADGLSQAIADLQVRQGGVSQGSEDRGWQWPVAQRAGAVQYRHGMVVAAAVGAPVQAVADGEVMYAGDDVPGYGQLVLLRHADKRISVYARLGMVQVHTGDRLHAGDMLAAVGGDGIAGQQGFYFEARQGEAPIEAGTQFSVQS